MKKKTLILLLVTILIIAATVPLMACTGTGSNPAPTPTPTTTPLPTWEGGPFYYNGQYLGANESSDADHDWVTDRMEYWTYHTNPLSNDSNGNGLCDFNELFVYPNYSSDAQTLVEMAPRLVKAADTGFLSFQPHTTALQYSALNDPIVKWYANNTRIVWQNNERGSLKIDNEPFWMGDGVIPGYDPRQGEATAAYYFAHGRIGKCGFTADAIGATLTLNGYRCWFVVGNTSLGEHGWIEAEIDNAIYVCNFNEITIASVFYSAHPDWAIEYKWIYGQ